MINNLLFIMHGMNIKVNLSIYFYDFGFMLFYKCTTAGVHTLFIKNVGAISKF